HRLSQRVGGHARIVGRCPSLSILFSPKIKASLTALKASQEQTERTEEMGISQKGTKITKSRRGKGKFYRRKQRERREGMEARTRTRTRRRRTKGAEWVVSHRNEGNEETNGGKKEYGDKSMCTALFEF